MTEPIIIDGVNVAECVYAILPKNQCPAKSMPYAKETSCIACKEHNTKLNFCKNNPDCYFKQLKRLEKENEMLEEEKQEKIHLLEQIIKTLYPNADDDTLFDIAFNCSFIEDTQKLKQENEELKEKNSELLNLANNGGALLIAEKAKTDKYKQALEEIRKEIGDLHDNANRLINLQKILDIINEVLNEQK